MTVADTLSGHSTIPTYCGIMQCYTLTYGIVR